MPVSLYDMMRPAAIAGGLGAGCAEQSGVPLVVGGLVGLAAGVVAFLVVGRLAKAWFARRVGPIGDTPERAPTSDAAFGAVYVAVFASLFVATVIGTQFGRWLVNEATF